MTELLLRAVYILALAYFVVGIVAFWRYDKVTRKADKMLEDLKRGDNDGILEVQSDRQT